MTVIEKERHMDLMVEMVGHTEEEGYKVIRKEYKHLSKEEANNRITCLAAKAALDVALVNILAKYRNAEPETNFEAQVGDSVLEDDSVMFWFIISEKL